MTAVSNPDDSSIIARDYDVATLPVEQVDELVENRGKEATKHAKHRATIGVPGSTTPSVTDGAVPAATERISSLPQAQRRAARNTGNVATRFTMATLQSGATRAPMSAAQRWRGRDQVSSPQR